MSPVLVLGLCSLASGQCESEELDKLAASDAIICGIVPTGGELGVATAIHGDVIVSGAPLTCIDGQSIGAAYVYRFDGVSWVEEAKLVGADSDPGDGFGTSVAVHGDLIVVGANSDDSICPGSPFCLSGSAYVFRYDGVTWVEEAKLIASHLLALDLFGSSVAVRDDVVVVGALHADGGAPDSGSATVFRYVDGEWVEEFLLTADDSNPSDSFGHALALGDGVLAVGAPFHDPPINVGAVYWFEDTGEGDWILTQKIQDPDGVAQDAFGMTLALDGSTMVVGTPLADGGTGRAHVLTHDGVAWTLHGPIVPADLAAADRFGTVVDIDDDTVLVTSMLDDRMIKGSPVADAGAGYLFEYDSQSDTWVEAAKLVKTDPGPSGYFDFGEQVGQSGGLHAGQVVLGGPYVDASHGALFVFGGVSDCNGNGTLDACDIASGDSQDENLNGIPDDCECEADFDGNGTVGAEDLLALLGAWGACPDCVEDLDGTGTVDAGDLLAFLAAWGACSG